MHRRIVCLGELLLRLSAPGRELLLQHPEFQVHVGGAEANVAVALARFGHSVSMASIVPDNPLGQAAAGELRRHGVDAHWIASASGRMGLYFLATGALQRSSEVLYDRAGSAFVLHAGTLDPAAFLAGAGWLHVSGVTPALGAGAADLARRTMRTAADLGLAVSFDCNYRQKLWDAWDSTPAATLRELAGMADLLFGDERDLGLMLGADFGAGATSERFARAGEAAFGAFDRLQRIAATIRVQRSVDHHEISAQLLNRETLVRTREYSVGPIVDRIGTGDAFAAGVIHGLRTGRPDAWALDFGLAAAVLKHSVPGDFLLLGSGDVEALLDDSGFGVRR